MKNLNIRGVIEQAYGQIEAAVRDRQALVADPHPRKADQAAAIDAIDARMHDAIRRATESVRAEGEKIATTYRRHKKSSYDDAVVASAWTRISKLLDANAEGVDEVVSRFGQPGYGREAAEAIRQNLSTRKTLARKGTGKAEVDREVAEDLDRVERGELPLMGYDERVATEAELDRRGGDAALKALQRAAATARTTGTLPAVTTLEMGHALGHGQPVAPR